MSSELVMGQDILKQEGKAKRRTFYGIGCILFGIFGFFTEITDKGEDRITGIILALAFIFGGIVLFKKSSEAKKYFTRVKQYMSMLQNDPITEINHIAEVCSINSELVKNDILKMIDERYLIGAYIDNQSNRVVFNDTSSNNENGFTKQTFVTVKCSGCGAENRIKQGGSGECEYCGSPISDNQ